MAYARGSIDKQNKSGESGHPCHVPLCKGKEVMSPVKTLGIDLTGHWFASLDWQEKCEGRGNV